jgi:hypothetical protein
VHGDSRNVKGMAETEVVFQTYAGRS